MNNRFFPAPWGGRVIWITLITLSAAIAFSAYMVPVYWKFEGRPISRWIIPVMFPTIFGIAALFVVRGFELGNEAILVRRSFWKTTIPIDGFISAEMDPKAMSRAEKVIGSDGLFAIYGRFKSDRLGTFQAYVTDTANCVVLRFTGRTVVLSPGNPRSFIDELEYRKRSGELRS